MKLLLIWGVSGVAFAALWLFRLFGVIDTMTGLLCGVGVVGYMIGIVAATWAMVERQMPGNAESINYAGAIGKDEAPPILNAAGVAHYAGLRDRFCRRPI